MSKTIQNGMISVIGTQIRNSILSEVKMAKYYSIIADEVSDVATIEQLSMLLLRISCKRRILFKWKAEI